MHAKLVILCGVASFSWGDATLGLLPPDGKPMKDQSMDATQVQLGAPSNFIEVT